MADLDEQEKSFLIAQDSIFTAKPCLSCSAPTVRKRLSLRNLIIWLPSFIALILSAIVVCQWRETASLKDDCFPFWTPSDFDAVKKEIPTRLQQTPFSAGLKYNTSQQLYRLTHSDQTPYVGEPSQELDNAWQQLIGAVNVFVTPAERAQFKSDMYFDPDSRLYMGVVTVFHDLHCLNMLRRNLVGYDHPGNQSHPEGMQTHLDHCIDSLRLSIMCTGDMTISPTMWSHEKGRVIPDFEVDHTCRDYGALKEWADARDSADPERYPENAKRLHAAIKKGTKVKLAS